MRALALKGLLAAVAVVFLARPVSADNYSWSAAVSDDWSNPLRWDPNGVPGLADSVSLNVGGGPTYTVTVSNAQAVGFLSISSGQAALRNFSGADTFTVTNLVIVGGSFQQDGGTLNLSGGGTVFGSGTFAFSGGTVLGTGALDVFNGGFTWGGGTLQTLVRLSGGGALVGDLAAKEVGAGGSLHMNGGTTTFQGELVYIGNGSVAVGSGATMNWLGDGVVRLGSSYSGPASFTNGGVVLKSGGAGAGRFAPGLTLTNTGTIRVSSGSLWIESDLTNTGTLRADVGAELLIRAGTTVLGSGSQITGAGTFRLAGGSPAAAALDIQAATAAAAATAVHLESGTVQGTGTLTINGPLTWKDAVVGGSATVTALGGGSIAGTIVGNPTITTGTVNLAGGTFTWSAGNLTFDGGGRLVVGPGGTLTAGTGSGSLALNHVSGTPVIRNEGTFQVAVSGGGSLLVPASITIENVGTLRVATGSIDLRGGLINSGTIDLAASTLLSVNGGTLTLNPGSAVTGAGRIAMTGPGSALTLNTAFTSPAGLQYTIGTINGTGSLAVGGPFDWGVSDAGAVGGSVTITAGGGGDWTAAGTRRINTGSVNLTGGTFDWAGGPVAFTGSGSLTVGAGAVLNLQDDSSVTRSGGAPVVTVNGALQKSGGTGTSVAAPAGATFTSGGVVSVTAGTLYFDPAATLTNYSSGTLAGGTWRAAGATLDLASRPVSVVAANTTVEVSGPTGSFPALTSLSQNNGTVRVLNGAALAPTATLVNTAGVVEVGAGSTFGSALVVQTNGTVAGAGTLPAGVGVMNGGRLSPGPGPAAAPGPAALNLGLTVMLGGSRYVWDLNSWTGGTAGVHYDQLKGLSGARMDLSLASAVSPVVLQIRGLTAANAPGPIPGFDPNLLRSWVIADYTAGNTSGGVTAFSPDKFVIDTTGVPHDLMGGTFSLSTDPDGNRLVLTFTPVPEPGFVLLACALAGAGLAAARRRQVGAI